jgi:hypothetical protein
VRPPGYGLVMAQEPLTFARAMRQPPHWSAFWTQLTRRAGGAAQVTNWLIAQANARGFHGAFVDRESKLDPWLSLEDLVVGLLMPHAELDARVIKLITRVMQSGKLDAEKLAFRARRERADVGLTWLLSLVPEGERTPPLIGVSEALRPPRGNAKVTFNYDPQRLVRRPATKEQLWRVKQR